MSDKTPETNEKGLNSSARVISGAFILVLKKMELDLKTVKNHLKGLLLDEASLEDLALVVTYKNSRY